MGRPSRSSPPLGGLSYKEAGVDIDAGHRTYYSLS